MENLRFQLGLISPEQYKNALEAIRQFREQTSQMGQAWENIKFEDKVKGLIDAQVQIATIIDVLGGPSVQLTQTLEKFGISVDAINKGTEVYLNDQRENLSNIFGTTEALKNKLIPSLSDTNVLTNSLSDSIDMNTQKFNTMATAISNVTQEVNKLTNQWSVAGTAGVWTFKSAEDAARLIPIIQGANAANAVQLQSGGFITREGLAYVHKGESVIPKGGTTSNFGDISVSVTTGPISSPADENELARKVSDKIMADIQNYTKYVGHF